MSDYTDTLQRGDKIGCYRIEEVLGRGGFAVTYLATDENLDVEVAIKEYLPREITQRDNNLQVSPRKDDFAEDYAVGLENFAREAKTLARFKHPHIVRVHQVLHANNTAYMVMDFEQGQELAEILEQNETLPEEDLRAILFPILDGVEEIHRHGFVHRDIKPSNIYVRHNGSPVLIDFGAARYTMSETTQQLTAVVTVGYTPIEQYNVSEDSQGPWSDIYALAAVCYEAVTGDVPTDSVTRASASVTKGDDPLPSVREFAKQRYSDDCLDAIDWGLRMDAEDRPQVTAQWRDSFDGIFNPASAYIAKENSSIYSPARAVDGPLHHKNRNRQSADTHTNAAMHNADDRYSDDMVSIPLNQTERPLDSGIVALDTDTHSVTGMPPIPPGAAKRSTTRVVEDPVSNRGNTGNNDGNNNDTQRNVLRRDTGQPDTDSGTMAQPVDASPTLQPTQTPEAPKRKRSKLERPTHMPEPPQSGRQRTLNTVRDEIEFDESDWDYEPPKSPSAWRLVIPGIGLAAVVGASILFVNRPDIISNLGGLAGIGDQKSAMSTDQMLDMASLKMNSSQYLFPEGDSAIDYYNQALDVDPGNLEARTGVTQLEAAVRGKISDSMNNDDLSTANRLLARADSLGLTGIYATQTATNQTAANQASTNQAPAETTTTPVTTTAQTEVQSTFKDETAIVRSVDTTPLQPQAPTQTTQPEQVVAAINNEPNTGIDNNLSPFIKSQIDEIESLVQQQRFGEARVMFNDTDKFIADSALSQELLSKIEFGEREAASERLASTTQQQPTTPVVVTPEPVVVAEPVVTEPARQQNTTITTTGSTAEYLSQLRSALENKNMAGVEAISEAFPSSRTQFLNRMFKVYDRIDVSIDDINDSGSSVTAKLNVSMFNQNDDGSFYSAGKWSGVTLNSAREDGVWQKIRW